MVDLGAFAVLEWGGSGAPATLFGWDRLVGAGGPEVAVLCSPALCAARVALHSSRKVPTVRSVGWFVRQIERAMSLVLFLRHSFSLELAWGKRGRGEKVKIPSIMSWRWRLGVVSGRFSVAGGPGRLTWHVGVVCVSGVVVVGLA